MKPEVRLELKAVLSAEIRRLVVDFSECSLPTSCLPPMPEGPEGSAFARA